MNMFFQPTFQPTQIRRPEPNPRWPFRISFTLSFMKLVLNVSGAGVPIGVEFSSVFPFFFIGGDVEVIRYEGCPGFEAVAFVFVVATVVRCVGLREYESAWGALSCVRLGYMRRVSLIVAWMYVKLSQSLYSGRRSALGPQISSSWARTLTNQEESCAAFAIKILF
jgi:hypothetical protein